MAEENGTVVAESSTAPQLAEVFEGRSEAEISEWKRTGEFPEPKAEESAPSQKTEQTLPEKTESAPAPDATKQQEKRQEYNWKALREAKESAERRVRELEAEAAKHTGKQDEKSAESSTAKPEANEPPKKPLLENFENYQAFEEAMDKYFESLADFKADQRLTKFKEEQKAEAEKKAAEESSRTRQQNHAKNWKESTQTLKDFDQVARNEDGSLVILPLLRSNPVIDDFVYESPAVGQLIYHLTQNLDEAERITGLAPLEAVRELVKLELNLSNGTSASPAKPKPAAPPKPPTELSGTNTAPEDEALAALEAGDVRRYNRIMNQRDLAAHKA